MENVKQISTRESFGMALAQLEDERIVVLDADLCTSTKTNIFMKKHPERFIQNGIAETDMICTSAGLATCGKIPFAVTFAVFATGRCYDQIRTSIAYTNLNVKICGTHSGITVGEDGAIHQMIEDISLMRTLPNMTVLSSSDDVQTRKLVKEIAQFEGPVYLRLGRMKTPVIYEENETFEIGKAKQFGEGTVATVFATGDVVVEALKAQKLLKDEGIDIRVIDMYSIKPLDKEIIIKSAKETKLLISVEDHSIIGGLGSAISEVLCEECPERLIRLGIQDKFGKSGKPEALLKYYGIDSRAVIEQVYKNMIN